MIKYALDFRMRGLEMPTTSEMFADAQIVYLEFIREKMAERKISGDPRMIAETQIVETMKDA